MQKEVMISISDVKYYQEHSSLVIVGIESESKKPITQQVTVRALLLSAGIFSPDDIEKVLKDHDKCRLFASQLKARNTPFKLVFEDSKTEEQTI